MAMLQRMEVVVAISLVPSEVADPIPFPEDTTHDTYDPAHVARFHQVLAMVDVVMKQHRAVLKPGRKASRATETGAASRPA